ncbi:MAG: hypothetical protein ACYTFG_10455 [Planctomycetota bacterium]|jgi:uncharacterized protein YbaR (Trm112 family)
MARMKIIRCPLCKGKLEIDLNTGQVYRHFEKMKEAEAADAFDKIVDKVAEKENSGEDVFEKAAEREKAKNLDALFQEAADKAKDDIEEETS